MIQPKITAEVLSLKSEKQSYKDRTNNTTREYFRHILNCIIGDEVAGVSVMCEADAPRISFKRGDKVEMAILSYSVESGMPIIKVKENDIRPVKG